VALLAGAIGPVQGGGVAPMWILAGAHKYLRLCDLCKELFSFVRTHDLWQREIAL